MPHIPVEIGPALSLSQIIGIIMGLSIAGGMLIPGNIPTSWPPAGSRSL